MLNKETLNKKQLGKKVLNKFFIDKSISRRELLKAGAKTTGAVAGLGMASGLTGVAPAFAVPTSAGSELVKKAVRVTPQRKALVFIMLDGGNDSFNMLVPTDKKHYKQYQQTRSNLALANDELLPLQSYKDEQGRSFGLHPSMPEVQQLFNQQKLAFVANMGPLIQPVSKQSFKNGSAPLPLGLMSHADQFKHWQTSMPDQRLNQGWFGRFADTLQPSPAPTDIPMNISLAGSNIMQNGVKTQHYSVTDKGSVGLVVHEESSPLNDTLLASFNDLITADYHSDPFKQSYLLSTWQAQQQHQTFKMAVQQHRVPGSFADTPLSQQLKQVAKTIKAADELGTPQQTFFLRYIGWDHHDELLNSHAEMLRVLSQALGEFQQALEVMGLDDQVITFTGSDFGRTLTSNGNGTDHGWGGNTLVMGNAVAGGQVFGQYPDLTLGDQNPLDVGDGVLIPTTAIDQLYAELALWFGIKRRDLPLMFPNLKHFYNMANFNQALPLGVVPAAAQAQI